MGHLDPAQAAAAKSAAEIQLTLAGPGAGKTSMLAGRFLYLVGKGADPACVLVMTYTKKAADELKARLARLLELPSAKGLPIATFHAFAFRQLRRDRPRRGSRNVSFCGPRPSSGRFSAPAACGGTRTRTFSTLSAAPKSAFSTPPPLTRAAGDDEIKEAAVFFRVYETALKAAGAIDFADDG